MNGNGTILIVDDERTLARAIRGYLAEAGYEAEVAHDAESALPMLEKLRPDVVFTDVQLPGMNGIEFLRELRSDPALASTPVVVLTTSNNDRDKIEAYNFNVAGYLVKPVTFNDFSELMVTLNKYWTLVELP